MSRPWKIILAVAALVLAGMCSCMVIAGAASVAATSLVGGERVGVVRVEGVIATGTGTSLGGSAATDTRVIADLERAAADSSIAAVVLLIDSPGGAVYASDRIYSAVAAMDKPVVAYLGETAASGGYYIACGADRIVAHPTTLTGSIGVIMQTFDASGLLERIGVRIETIRSAEHKDMGSYSRPLTDEERVILQEVVDESYARFVDIVADARALPREEVLEVADGRVFTGSMAVEYGLVDSTGDLEDAVRLAGSLAGLEGTPETVELTSGPTLWESLMSTASAIRGLVSGGGVNGPVVLYLMAP